MLMLKNAKLKITQGKLVLLSTTLSDPDKVWYAKGGKAPVQNITQNTAPWGPQQGYLQQGFAEAQNVLNKPHTFFPGQTYAAFSPQTQQALNLTEQRALAGSPLMGSTNEQLLNTINGNNLFGGPGYNEALQAAQNQILPGIQSRYAKGGRFGSGLGRAAEAQALGDVFAQQYGAERQNQMRAMGMAPQMAQNDYFDIGRLATVGEAKENQEQKGIDQAMAKHGFDENEQLERIRNFMALIQGNYGQQGLHNTQGFKGSKAGGLLGGAMGGAGLAQMIGGAAGGPLGLGIGALTGGLLGGLF